MYTLHYLTFFSTNTDEFLNHMHYSWTVQVIERRMELAINGLGQGFLYTTVAKIGNTLSYLK